MLGLLAWPSQVFVTRRHVKLWKYYKFIWFVYMVQKDTPGQNWPSQVFVTRRQVKLWKYYKFIWSVYMVQKDTPGQNVTMKLSLVELYNKRHLVYHISAHIRFDLERYLLNSFSKLRFLIGFISYKHRACGYEILLSFRIIWRKPLEK